VEQDKSLVYHLEMYESTPLAELTFQPTVPLSTELHPLVVIPVVSQVGLTVSTCSLTFGATEGNSSQNILRIGAVRTAGRNSRIMAVEFGSIEADGLPWHGYALHRILVKFSLYLQLQLFLCVFSYKIVIRLLLHFSLYS